MTYTPPPAPPSSNNTLRIILIVVAALIVLCLCIPICLVGVYALLGPQFGTIFSQLTPIN